MATTKFEFKEKHHFLEIDGVSYEIPQRTEALQRKIDARSKRLHEMTEYEGNISLLEILFGKANAKRMFPDKAATNLDKLARAASYALALFTAEAHAIREEKLAESMKSLEPYLQKLNIGNELAGKSPLPETKKQ